MTTVKYTDRDIHVFDHSGYAPAGSDIVCAGISTLVQTLIMAVEQMTRAKIKYSICSENCFIHFQD